MVVVVKDSIDNSIADSFGNDLLGLFNTLERKLFRDILNRNLRVRDVDLLETELDHSVTKTLNQGEIFVSMEKGLILDQKGLEVLHVARLDTSNNLIVRKKLLLEVGVREDLSVGNVTHQKLSNHLKLNNL